MQVTLVSWISFSVKIKSENFDIHDRILNNGWTCLLTMTLIAKINMWFIKTTNYNNWQCKWKRRYIILIINNKARFRVSFLIYCITMLEYTAYQYCQEFIKWEYVTLNTHRWTAFVFFYVTSLLILSDDYHYYSFEYHYRTVNIINV